MNDYLENYIEAEPEEEVAFEQDTETEKEAVRQERAYRSRRRWRRFLCIYSLVFLLVGAAGCFVLYRYSAAYERSLPEHVMDSLMEITTADDWYDYISESVDMPVSKFEDGHALFQAYYDSVIRNADFIYRKMPGEYTNGTPVYQVRAAGSNLCKVTLIPQGTNAAGFGRELWQVESIESCYQTDGLESVSVEIDAPQDAAIAINGISVTEEYLTGEQAPCPDMNALESRFNTAPSFVRYRVEKMFGEITVTDAAGRELEPDIDSETRTVRYVAPQDELYSFSVRAPQGVTVCVNGAELTEEDATSSSDGILTGLEKYTDGKQFRTLWYSYEKLYSNPEDISASYGGQSLVPLLNEKGELIYFYPDNDTLREAMMPVVETFFNRYMDYSAKAYNDENYAALLSSILPGTELYNYVRDSVDAMIWASATEVDYDELEFENFAPVSENCFTCTIRYKADFSVKAWHSSYSYDLQNAYELAFVKEGEIWYAAAMSAVAG